MINKTVEQLASVGFLATASEFLGAGFIEMVPWIIVMIAVIVCDLASGVRRAILMKERVRFSSACRRTIGKMVTYVAFVIMVVFINSAAKRDLQIDHYACLLICFIEGSSVISNILRPLGYDFNMTKLFNNLTKTKFKNLDGVITKKEEEDGKCE
ncbi:MAG: phage holin family protein [Bacteroidales bacterium]